ncbi:hypothetical protein SASPL_131174 [Salvia splendens]|uniref:Protein kinase domain-containing protein n=1 Tax=Salvia splendens TaxID=180675 RepID=A0A8X8X9K6_SALSN|nr:hypothetical protein SASPL_131173 [Salvia splendens]KAG6408170.1 hypothetical protein SASPL_131174 [Salvia splendens]
MPNILNKLDHTITMMPYALYWFLFISIYSTVRITSISTAAYTATELILLSCGSSTITNDASNRSWVSDQGSKYVPSYAPSISLTSDASTMEPMVFAVPYKTARVFHSPFTYTFPLTEGQKFLRLHFYPNIYSNVDTNPSLFSVKANAFTLLHNFSAFLHSRYIKRHAFMMEFIVKIGATQKLDLTFTPNPESSAFVNGIEIVSIPDKLYLSEEGVQIKYVDQLFYLDSNTALENLYRLNVGGTAVLIEEDSGPTRGMFRGWSPDDDYIYYGDRGYTRNKEEPGINYSTKTPPYTAPPKVYTSARTMTNISLSLEWGFPVDSGFNYLLRFHFCDFVFSKENDLKFRIEINNQTVDPEVNVIFFAGGPDIPIARDYITWVPDDGNRGKQDLRLSLVPSLRAGAGPEYISAILNGLEIFKLNDSKGSFAASNPELEIDSPPASVAGNLPPKKKTGVVIYTVVGSVIGVVVVVAAVMFLIFRRKRKVKDAGTSVTKSSWVPLSTHSKSTARTSRSGVSLPSDICRYFSIDEIKSATRNFDDNFVIGRGGFGNVYKGLIDNAATTVAIKRLNSTSNQGAREFLTEIDMLSKLRHLHLIIDSNLKGQIAPECLTNFAEIGVACLRDKGIDRPSMNDIVWKLEFAMQLQVSSEGRGGAASLGEDKDDGFTALNPSLPLLGIGTSTTTDGETFSRSRSSEFSTSSSEKLKSGDAFSEIMNPSGR